MRRGTWKRFAMRPLALCAACILATSVSLLSHADGQLSHYQTVASQKASYAPGQLIVKLKGSLGRELLERYGLSVLERLSSDASQSQLLSLQNDTTLYLLHTDSGQDIEALTATLSLEDGVEYAEPVYIYPAQVQPNDPLYPPVNAAWWDAQWAPKRIGMEGVWREKTSTRVVKVNLDSGVDLMHPDIQPNLWRNDAEASGLPGVDDDGNGYRDDVYGWDFVNNRPLAGDLSSVGHGTATFLDTRGNNSIGTAGINWQCQVMSLAVIGSEGAVTGDIIKAIEYARVTLAKQGKRGVFNASFAGPGRSQALLDTINAAQMLFVASSGNYGNENPSGVYYPAGLNAETPYVISATGSTYDSDDKILPGASWVGADIAAPGAWILVPAVGGDYTHAGGTSLASPHVASALALVLDIEPDPLKAKARILKSADRLPALEGRIKTGRLNVDRAYRGVFNPNSAPEISADSLSIKGAEGGPLPMSVRVTDHDGDTVSVTWRFSNGQTFSGASIAPVLPLGNYWATVTVSDGIAETMLTFTIQITDRVDVRPKVKGTKKLTLTVTSSRQDQNPRPKIVIRELNQEIPYDEESRAYKIVFNIKKNPIPSPLTIESELGGSFTLSWR